MTSELYKSREDMRSTHPSSKRLPFIPLGGVSSSSEVISKASVAQSNWPMGDIPTIRVWQAKVNRLR